MKRQIDLTHKSKNYHATIISNKLIDYNVFLIHLFLPGFDGNAEPGQFVMVNVNTTYDPFLRRPYSILESKEERLKLLVKIVGKGSMQIAMKRRNEKIEVLGPLGVGFSVKSDRYPLLVAGGMGIVPIWFLAKKLRKEKKDFSIIYGERTMSFLSEEIGKTFEERVFFTTDDGSRGMQATASASLPYFIGNLPNRKLSIYGCGPKKMLKEVIDFGEKKNIPVYVSLEERMACGTGICLGCSVKKKKEDGFLSVCQDGPVFNGNEVKI